MHTMQTRRQTQYACRQGDRHIMHADKETETEEADTLCMQTGKETLCMQMGRQRLRRQTHYASRQGDRHYACRRGDN